MSDPLAQRNVLMNEFDFASRLSLNTMNDSLQTRYVEDPHYVTRINYKTDTAFIFYTTNKLHTALNISETNSCNTLCPVTLNREKHVTCIITQCPHTPIKTFTTGKRRKSTTLKKNEINLRIVSPETCPAPSRR